MNIHTPYTYGLNLLLLMRNRLYTFDCHVSVATLANLGFFRGGLLWEPERVKRASIDGGLGLRENEI